MNGMFDVNKDGRVVHLWIFEFRIQRFVPEKMRVCKPCLSRGVGIRCFEDEWKRKFCLKEKRENGEGREMCALHI